MSNHGAHSIENEVFFVFLLMSLIEFLLGFYFEISISCLLVFYAYPTPAGQAPQDAERTLPAVH
ncbi:hypothetical protein [Aeromonas sp. Y318-1]|uniref:hypothetical protein n=1 Tax=Aeromonas TaxID=642 RepID=UPI0022E25570|nr:hypothetical protein [Aeromonas sp. Y318-1]